MDIVELKKITNTKLKNLHDNRISVFTQDLLKIKFEDGQVRTIALFMETDITDVDYYEVLYTPRTKEIMIMHDDILDEIPYW